MSAHVEPVHGGNSAMSDAALVHAIASGDHDAFRALMRKYDRLLRRTARGILKNEDDAQDALQNAYLLVYLGIGRFRGEAGLSTWLVRVVINEAFGFLRKRARSAHVVNLVSSEFDAAIEAEASRNSDQGERPEDVLMRVEAQELVRAKVDELPAAFRAVVVLRSLEELSVAETAGALKIPAATVRTRLFRARAQLRESISVHAAGVVDMAVPTAGRARTASDRPVGSAEERRHWRARTWLLQGGTRKGLGRPLPKRDLCHAFSRRRHSAINAGLQRPLRKRP